MGLICFRWVQSIAVSVSVCLSVSAHMSKHVFQISPNFLHALPVAVAWSSSDGNAIRYVLPVLWMTACFHKVEGIGLI